MAPKINEYRASAVRCEQRAKKTRNQADRDWYISRIAGVMRLGAVSAPFRHTLPAMAMSGGCLWPPVVGWQWGVFSLTAPSYCCSAANPEPVCGAASPASIRRRRWFPPPASVVLRP
jgi:hypothetical protein